MATPIRKCCSFFYFLLSIFYKDQNRECSLRKFEKCFIVLEKYAVNVEVRKKERIVYKGEANLILALSRCLTYKKVSRIKFTRLFVVRNKRVLLGSADILRNYGIFKHVQWETDVKKVFKSISCSI